MDTSMDDLDASASQNATSEAMPHECESERHAVGVSPEIKTSNLNRLRRIEGQVRGVQRMVTEDRYCVDIIMQIASIHEALRGVSRELLRNHMRHCVSAAIKNDRDVEHVYSELAELMERVGR